MTFVNPKSVSFYVCLLSHSNIVYIIRNTTLNIDNKTQDYIDYRYKLQQSQREFSSWYSSPCRHDTVNLTKNDIPHQSANPNTPHTTPSYHIPHHTPCINMLYHIIKVKESQYLFLITVSYRIPHPIYNNPPHHSYPIIILLTKEPAIISLVRASQNIPLITTE